MRASSTFPADSYTMNAATTNFLNGTDTKKQLQYQYQLQYQNQKQSQYRFSLDCDKSHDGQSKQNHSLSQSCPATTSLPMDGKLKIISHEVINCNNAEAIVKTKSTVLIHDSSNGRINTSLTSDSDSEFGGNSGCCAASPVEHDAFLSSGSSSTSEARRARLSLQPTYGKAKSSVCYRVNTFITRNWYLSYLVPLTILLALMFVAYLTRDYAKQLLFWIETQNTWLIFGIFMLLFVVVSFPVVVGYFVLMITSGYLFGFLKGFLTVILGANLGIAIAHCTIRSFRHRIPIHKIIKNETGRAILRVISGPRAFKVVLFTRLTPIPFGLQNAIFGVSSINQRIYHTATFLGLLPAQTINVYLGSTLRSMHEVLNNHGTAVTGYISFGVEVVCGVALMFWVVQKARKELSETLLSDISTEGKIIDIQV